MTIEYLKRASRTPETESAHAREVASAMLADIEARGEAAVRDYAARLDAWHGDIVVSPEEIERRTRNVPAAVRQDIEFATTQVRRDPEALQLAAVTPGPPADASNDRARVAHEDRQLDFVTESLEARGFRTDVFFEEFDVERVRLVLDMELHGI